MTSQPTPDPLAYGPTGYRCGCGKDAHSNLVPCQPDQPTGQPLDLDAIETRLAKLNTLGLPGGTWTASPRDEKSVLPPEMAHVVEDVLHTKHSRLRSSVGVFGDEAHAEFAAHAPADVDALAREVRRLRAELATEQAQHAYTLRQRNNRSERLNYLRDLAKSGQVQLLAEEALNTLAASVNDHVPADGDEMAASLRRDGFGDDEIADMLGRRPCGHDDYHDAHEWADRPGVWCPGRSLDAAAAPSA